MRWGNMHDIYFFFFQFLCRSSLFIQINILILYTHTAVDFCNLWIPRILHSITDISPKKLDQNTIQILCSCSDNDLFRSYIHGTKFFKITGNTFPQFHHTSTGGIDHHFLLIIIHDCPHGLIPD